MAFNKLTRWQKIQMKISKLLLKFGLQTADDHNKKLNEFQDKNNPQFKGLRIVKNTEQEQSC